MPAPQPDMVDAGQFGTQALDDLLGGGADQNQNPNPKQPSALVDLDDLLGGAPMEKPMIPSSE